LWAGGFQKPSCRIFSNEAFPLAKTGWQKQFLFEAKVPPARMPVIQVQGVQICIGWRPVLQGIPIKKPGYFARFDSMI